jgi:hypothetical protein
VKASDGRPDLEQLEQLAFDLTGLAELGLAAGDRVRFRRRAGGRWHQGVVAGRHRDGSVALHEDGDGRARAIPADRLEVRRAGPRGGARWLPVVIARR